MKETLLLVSGLAACFTLGIVLSECCHRALTQRLFELLRKQGALIRRLEVERERRAEEGEQWKEGEKFLEVPKWGNRWN